MTELDQVALFRPLTKWNASLDNAARLPAAVRAAFRAMTTGRPGATHLAFPFDTQKGEVDETEIWSDPRHSIFPAERVAPDPGAVLAAADILAEATNAIAICGGGPIIAGAEQELARLVRVLDMPVATTVSGQGVIAESDPLALGVVGSNGGVPATRVEVDAADVVLFLGCRAGSVTTERWRSPSAKARIIHIDSDPDVIGANYQTEVAVVGDARLSIAALADALETRSTSSQNGAVRAAKAWETKLAAFHPLASSDERPIRPEVVMAALMDALPVDAVVCADPGTPCPYFSAHYRWQVAGRYFITNRAHGALGYSLGAAIGAQMGRPNATVLSVMGDGSFGFACGEYETITRYNLPIKSIVFSNSVYGWIKAGQNVGFGKRFYNVDFNRTDHAAVARAFGVRSWTVENPRELPSVIAQSLAHNGPTLIDVISQPLHEATAPVSEWVA